VKEDGSIQNGMEAYDLKKEKGDILLFGAGVSA
jgi:hypothetical protein